MYEHLERYISLVSSVTGADVPLRTTQYFTLLIGCLMRSHLLSNLSPASIAPRSLPVCISLCLDLLSVVVSLVSVVHLSRSISLCLTV
jgi:hypothetical protein